MKIIIDTREQVPLTFAKFEDVKTCRDKLEAGDYSISAYDMPGDDASVIIERKKDTSELVVNMVANWERFTKELEILSKYKYKQILVCAPDNIEYLYDRRLTLVHPNYFYSKLAKVYLDYGVSTMFFENRNGVEQYIYRLFNRIVLSNEE